MGSTELVWDVTLYAFFRLYPKSQNKTKEKIPRKKRRYPWKRRQCAWKREKMGSTPRWKKFLRGYLHSLVFLGLFSSLTPHHQGPFTRQPPQLCKPKFPSIYQLSWANSCWEGYRCHPPCEGLGNRSNCRCMSSKWWCRWWRQTNNIGACIRNITVHSCAWHWPERQLGRAIKTGVGFAKWLVWEQIWRHIALTDTVIKVPESIKLQSELWLDRRQWPNWLICQNKCWCHRKGNGQQAARWDQRPW